MDVMYRSLLKKDVGFIEQQDSSPGMGNVENICQASFEHTRIGTQLAGADHVQRALQQLRYSLCSQGLSSAWGSVQNCHETLTFAANHIVDVLGRIEFVRGDK